MSYKSFNKALTLDWFEKHDHPHVLKYALPALDGDAEAAFTLSHTMSGQELGAVAVAMWRCKVPRPAFRAYFGSVWMHDHREVETAAQTRRTLAYMFRYAAFELPADLPDVKLVVLVRDPVERAYSAHAHEAARGYEDLSFAAALEADEGRLDGEVERLLGDPAYESHAHRHQAYRSRGSMPCNWSAPPRLGPRAHPRRRQSPLLHRWRERTRRGLDLPRDPNSDRDTT